MCVVKQLVSRNIVFVHEYSSVGHCDIHVKYKFETGVKNVLLQTKLYLNWFTVNILPSPMYTMRRTCLPKF